jgi:hypothetical protein
MRPKKRIPAAAFRYRRSRWRARSSIVAVLLWLSGLSAVWADAASDVAKLEAQCEAAREVKIKPLRDAEIAKCKADASNDPAYCERFWRDYGNATRRANGTMSPRLFDDLPECIAATNARAALNSDGR